MTPNEHTPKLISQTKIATIYFEKHQIVLVLILVFLKEKIINSNRNVWYMKQYKLHTSNYISNLKT